MPHRLASTFFARDAERVARALLGCTLVRVLDGERLAGRIVETEAYLGPQDRASHAFGEGSGRRTTRNEPMFASPGTSYVYFTYGMHFCMNVSCLRAGHPAAVLLRAMEPIEGLERMRANRGTTRSGPHPDIDLCRGPARLCRALAIGPPQNGLSTPADPTLWFERGRLRAGESVRATARIGIGEKAAEGGWRERPLRFFIEGSRFVSGPRG